MIDPPTPDPSRADRSRGDSSSKQPPEKRPETHPEEQPVRSEHAKVRSFHGWRLLGVIFLVIFAIAVISAAVDWWVIGPLEGRAPWL